MRKSSKSVSSSSLKALALGLVGSMSCVPAFADDVVNPGFETGNTNGWIANGGIWNSGTWPPPESEFSGPPQLLSIMNVGGVDAITGAPTVFAGNFSVRLNDQFGNNHITAIQQTVNNYNGNHIYYAWNAVLEPSHGATDSPSFIIKVIDETTNTVVTNIAYSAFTAQNTTIFRNVGNFVTSDWLVEDVNVTSGHTYRMIFVAVDCLYGGHGGYVYVDGFGNAIPIANPGVPFDPTTDVVQGSTILIPIGGGTPDIDLAKAFYTTVELAAGSVNPVFVGGTLQVANSGTIGTNFTVQAQGGTFDNFGNVVDLTGQFTGPGGMIFTGGGTTYLSNLNTINGAVSVNGGNLAVNGALSTLSVDVNSGATLSGQGAVVAPVTVNAGGTLAPGSQVGTLSVAGGPVTMAAGSTFSLDIDGRNYDAAGGAGTYDRLNVTGGTFNAGGVVAPNLRNIAAPANNNFTPVLGDRFTVVTADAVTGAFSGVTQPTSGLAANNRFDVLYGTNSIQLAVTPGSFGALGVADKWRLNAVRAAAGMDVVRPAAGARTGPAMNLFNGLYGMTSPQLGYAFQQLSGEIHSHALQMAQGSASRGTQAALSAIQDEGDCTEAGSTKPTDGTRRDDVCTQQTTSKGVRMWGKLNISDVQGDDDATAYRYNQDETGFILGADVGLGTNTRLGLGGRIANSKIKTPIGSNAKLDGGGVFAYASHDAGRLNLSAVLGWNKANVETSRTLGLLNGTTINTAKYDINTVSGAIEAHYSIPAGKNVVIRPVVGLEFENSRADAVGETGSDPSLALVLPKEKWSTTQSKVGLEIRNTGSKLQGKLFANWRHNLGGDTTAIRTARLAGASWNVSSVVADKDNIEAGGGVSYGLSDKVRIGAEYKMSRDGSYKVDSGTVSLNVRF